MEPAFQQIKLSHYLNLASSSLCSVSSLLSSSPFSSLNRLHTVNNQFEAVNIEMYLQPTYSPRVCLLEMLINLEDSLSRCLCSPPHHQSTRLNEERPAFQRLGPVYSSFPNTPPSCTLEKIHTREGRNRLSTPRHVHAEEVTLALKEGDVHTLAFKQLCAFYDRLILESSRPLKGLLAHLCKQLYIPASS